MLFGTRTRALLPTPVDSDVKLGFGTRTRVVRPSPGVPDLQAKLRAPVEAGSLVLGCEASQCSAVLRAAREATRKLLARGPLPTRLLVSSSLHPRENENVTIDL